MEKTYYRVFLSKNEEREWLNKNGEEGYLLTKISDSKYFFTHNKGKKYTYSIEYLNMPSESQAAEEYFDSRKNLGVVPIVSGGNWVYFACDKGAIRQTSAMYKKNSIFYFWRSLYLFFFAVFGSILCGYHVFATDYIGRAGHEGDGKIDLLEIEGSGFSDTLKEIWNNLLELLNATYVKLFTNIFGENDAALVLAVLIPIVIVFGVLFALNLSEYIDCRILENHARRIEAKEGNIA